jgi:hypothetical protein
VFPTGLYRALPCDRCLFHGGNTGSNPVGDANETEGIENRSKIINRKTFACFKDPAFYPPRQPLREQGILKFSFAMNPTFAPGVLETDYLGLGLLHQIYVA